MPEWITNKRKNWPIGSKTKALGGRSALEALEDEIRNNKANNLERLSDEELALAITGQLVKAMHRLGVRRAKGEGASK